MREMRVLYKPSVLVRGRKRASLRLGSIVRSEGLLEDLCPSKVNSQPFFLLGFEPAELDEGFDELGEALVPERSTDDSLGFRNIVVFSEGDRVTVGICDEGKGGRDEVRFGVAHEVFARNLELRTFRKVRGRVQQGKQNSAR